MKSGAKRRTALGAKQAVSSWQVLSLGSLRSAKQLLDAARADYVRSSVSRAYYAAYAAVTSRLPAKTAFPGGRNNPSHEQIVKLAKNLPFDSEWSRRQMVKALMFLRRQRETADYRPGHELSRSTALACLHWAGHVVLTLGAAKDDDKP